MDVGPNFEKECVKSPPILGGDDGGVEQNWKMWHVEVSEGRMVVHGLLDNGDGGRMGVLDEDNNGNSLNHILRVDNK